MDGLVESRERGYVCATPVHALMVAQDDHEMMSALRGATHGRARRHAARVGVQHARRVARRPRLRPRADAPLQRALRRARPPRVALRRPRPGHARAARAEPAPQPPEHPDRGRLLAALPPARRAGGEHDRRADQRRQARTCSGSGSACRSRRSGWPTCATGSTCRSCAASAPRSTSTPGRIPMAPRWMQDHGLEWVYRISQEPGRLLPRYLYYNPRFVLSFARQYLAER